MKSYQGHIFDIIWMDNGHALIRSEHRKDVAHSVDLHSKECTCENTVIDKNPECKHLRFMKAIMETVKELKENEKKACKPELSLLQKQQ